MGKRKSLARQVQEALQGKLCIGESKAAAKKQGTAQGGIYSWSTYRAYIKHLNYFATYCKSAHGCRSLGECKGYAGDWLETRRDLSPYTVKLEAAALRKLYGESLDLPPTAPRKRETVTRSRGSAVRDRNFSAANNRDLIAFCRSTGLRRHELETLHGDQLFIDDTGDAYLLVKGKGGRVRLAPIVGDVSAVVDRCINAGGGLVWGRVNSNADIHQYRADYCKTIYDQHARDLDRLPQSDRYYCRNDRKGTIFDRRAMLAASRALGHNRINIIASHYLR